jgi:DNA-binding MarR family transcriptional regulator
MNDITQNKHGGNANSKAAFGAIKDELKPRQNEVYHYIYCANGITCKDIAEAMNTGMNAISGRLTELKAMGKIKVTGRRHGCAIYEINEP